MSAPASPSPLRALRDNVSFWRAQSRQLERDRAHLRYLLALGPAAGAIVLLLSHHLGASLAVVGLFLVTWGLGLYMIAVRREEYAFALGAALAELAAATAGPNVP